MQYTYKKVLSNEELSRLADFLVEELEEANDIGWYMEWGKVAYEETRLCLLVSNIIMSERFFANGHLVTVEWNKELVEGEHPEIEKFKVSFTGKVSRVQ